jgi:REP element-mobilizing transposase RayT
MPRAARGTLDDGVFHVFARGNSGDLLFRDDRDYQTFLRLLATVAGENKWRLHAYCLMPNHFHLLVQLDGQPLSPAMRSLNGGYAQYFNRRYDRTGHVFQGRYDARPVEHEAYWEEARRYVLENAVRAGLCDRAEDYRWSALLVNE